MNFLNSIPALKFIADLPRKTAISLVVILCSTVLFGLLYPTLGGIQESAHAENDKLKRDIDQTRRNAQQSKVDKEFVLENKDKYEALLAGDRLVPHARRAAVRQLTELAQARGLSTLQYSFAAAGDQSATKVRSQPASGDYRVSVEEVDLKIGAPLDTQLLEFVYDLGDNFPGAAVVQSIQLDRVPKITDDMLDKVSGGGQDAGLVTGEVKFTWRTAQANEDDKKGGK